MRFKYSAREQLIVVALGVGNDRPSDGRTVAPEPISTPLIPSTIPADAVAKFGNTPLGRPGQAELATAYVMLADPLSSYVSGATIAVTGGRPML